MSFYGKSTCRYDGTDNAVRTGKVLTLCENGDHRKYRKEIQSVPPQTY